MEKARRRPELKKCCCPYCGEEIAEESLPFCQPCGVVIRYCAKCREPVAKEAATCPHCGEPVQRSSTGES